MSNLQGSSGDADIDNRPVDKSRGTGGRGGEERLRWTERVAGSMQAYTPWVC